MSTRVAGPQGPTIKSRDELVAYLEAGSKPMANGALAPSTRSSVSTGAATRRFLMTASAASRRCSRDSKDRFGWDAVLEQR